MASGGERPPGRPVKKKTGAKRPAPASAGNSERPQSAAKPAVKKKARPAPEAAPVPVKKKKKRRKSQSDGSGMLIIGLAAAAVLVVGGAVAAVAVMSKGNGEPTQQQTVAFAGNLPPRAPWPTPSEDPADWKTSFHAFAASLNIEKISERVDGRNEQRIRIDGGQVVLPSEEVELTWEARLQGIDRRGVAHFAPTPGKKAFKFDLPNLPSPLFLIFLIDDDRAAELKKLTYQRVRVKGRFWPTPMSVLEIEDEPRFAVEQLKLTGDGEPGYLVVPPDDKHRTLPNICLIYFDITDFDVVKGS